MGLDWSRLAIRGATQDHLPIADIRDDLVILKDGSCAMVLETSSVNFDLLSEKEQEAMIYAFAALLNSLTFPIQILVRSTLKDISRYVTRLKEQEKKITDPLLQKQITSYRRFVEEVVRKNNVLSKNFYVIIPFSALELGLPAATRTFPFLAKKTSNLPLPKDEIIKRAKASLAPKKEHLIRLFARLGLNLRQLTTPQLIKLFYRIYNEESLLVDNQAALSQLGVVVKGVIPSAKTKGD